MSEGEAGRVTVTPPGASPPGRPGTRLRRFLKGSLAYSLSIVMFAGILLGGLKLVDRAIGSRLPATPETDIAAATPTIRTLELYPYEGFHVQANFRHRGPMPWEKRFPAADYDVRSGDKGFFIDFQLDDPPPKLPGEVRIVLIGGSGAQGWGGTRNETMFYMVLERMLNARLAGRGVRVRVINLAMGGTTAYQNFLALNLYAHALEPDLILAYVGRNDFFVPVWHEAGTNAPLYFRQLKAFTLAARGSEYPAGMAWLMDYLPNIMRRTDVGLGIKIAVGWSHFLHRAWESTVRTQGRKLGSLQQVIDDYATPRLIHSLKSIKRDFDGVPILVAWQPIQEEFQILKKDLDPGFYGRMYERTRSELAGYVNDGWVFVNIHEIGRSIPDTDFDTHLDDAAHLLVGAILADRIEPLIPDLIAVRQERQAAGLPAYGR